MKKISRLFNERLNGSLKNKIFYNIFILLFSVSMGLLSVYLIPININTVFDFEIFTTLAITFIVSLLFSEKFLKKTFHYLKNNKSMSILLLIITFVILRKLKFTKVDNVITLIPSNMQFLFTDVTLIISGIALFCVLTFVVFKLSEFYQSVYHTLDKWDKKAYIVMSILSFILIVTVYNFNHNYFLQYDRVFSMDSGWVFNDMVPQLNYYDIRHPFISIFYFPIWAIIETCLNNIIGVTSLAMTIKAVILQFINSQLLIIVGLYLKKICENKNVFILYMLSFPTLTYLLFFEKYQLCVFMLVSYVYLSCLNKDDKFFITSAAGVMLTSCFIGITEILKNKNLKNIVLNIIKILIFALLFFVLVGRIHLITFGLSDALNMQKASANTILSFHQKIYSTFNMIQSTIVSVGTVNINGQYLWNDLTNELPLCGIIIFLISLIGAISKRKELISKISSIWIIFAFILFTFINWSTHESPLFNIYFSWAFIPMFVFGVDFIVEKLKLNSKFVYLFIYIIISFINISTLLDIYKFLI